MFPWLWQDFVGGVAMSRFKNLSTGGNPTQAVRDFLGRFLRERVVDALLVPTEQVPSAVVMQSLVSDPKELCHATPLAPVCWSNAGTLLSSVTHNAEGAPIAAVLRSCEARAFVERTKLNQGSRSGLLLLSIDCLGRFENRDYLALAGQCGNVTDEFLRVYPSEEPFCGFRLSRACRACEYPIAPTVDIQICLLGQDPFSSVLLEGVSDAGRSVLSRMNLPSVEPPSERDAEIAALVARRVSFRDNLLKAHREHTGSVPGLISATAACINCYNCRVACPLCYCRECVFLTDLFRHECAKYLAWAHKRGSLRIPTDTLFYHLTRLVHMSTMCVGCGQCSSACPNGIDVMELFRRTALVTQARFDYVPGRDFEEKQPLATFREDELGYATGNEA